MIVLILTLLITLATLVMAVLVYLKQRNGKEGYDDRGMSMCEMECQTAGNGCSNYRCSETMYKRCIDRCEGS